MAAYGIIIAHILRTIRNTFGPISMHAVFKIQGPKVKSDFTVFTLIR